MQKTNQQYEREQILGTKHYRLRKLEEAESRDEIADFIATNGKDEDDE